MKKEVSENVLGYPAYYDELVTTLAEAKRMTDETYKTMNEKTLYTLSYWDLGWVLEDNKLYEDSSIIIKGLEDSGFVFDCEDEDGIEYIREEGGYGDHAKIFKLTYEETTK